MARGEGEHAPRDRLADRPVVPGRLALGDALWPGAIPVDGLEDPPDGLIWAFALTVALVGVALVLLRRRGML